MEFISQIPILGDVLFYVIPFLIVLLIVVFVHEYGHYIVGRWRGIHAEAFSIGFGKELFGWTDSRGTRWKVSLIPLGGYVKFLGDSGASSRPDEEAVAAMSDEDRARAFPTAPLSSRTLTVLAGPVANFILSILVFAALAMTSGVATEKAAIGEAPDYSGLIAGDEVLEVSGEPIETYFDMVHAINKGEGEMVPALIQRGGDRILVDVRMARPAVIDDIAPSGAAAAAGLEVGDEVVVANGEEISSFRSLQRITRKVGANPFPVTVLRDGERLDFTITPRMIEREDYDTGEIKPLPTIGIVNLDGAGFAPARETVGPGVALIHGAEQTWGVIDLTISYLYRVIVGQSDPGQIGGPIRIAEISGEAADRGIVALVTMIAFLSTSIGLLNLFPIPVLDGGHLLFYAVEAIRGRPLRDRWVEIGMTIGFSLVILLMVFATYNDLSRL